MRKSLIIITSLILSLNFAKGQDTIAMWSFPTSTNKADKGTPLNLNNAVETGGGTATVMIKTPFKTYAAVCTGWDNGNGKKYWKVSLNTVNYKNLKLSSVVNACSGMNGPRDFKIQYETNKDGNWTDVPNSNIITDTGWIKGITKDLPLPIACENIKDLAIRWIMTSDSSWDAKLLTAGMMSKIDDIIFTGTQIKSNTDTIIYYSFNAGSNQPEKGTKENMGGTLFTVGASSISVSTFATATGWDGGKDLKYWKMEVNASNYKDLKISSVINACATHNGPRDFKIQYQLDCCSAWKDLPGGKITADTGWTKGLVKDIPLPVECENQPGLIFRWIMTSDTAANDSLVKAMMMSKIDNILITGTKMSNSVNEYINSNLSWTVYPMPAKDVINVKVDDKANVKNIEIISVNGQSVYNSCLKSNNFNIDIKSLPKGEYFLRIKTQDNAYTKKIIKL